MIVVIDHFDSFVETLARYVREAGFETLVMRQTVSVEDVLAVSPSAIILSPGPGGPDTTGVTPRLAGGFARHASGAGHLPWPSNLGGAFGRHDRQSARTPPRQSFGAYPFWPLVV